MQNSDTPKVSLLIPICNVERYLRECLDSAVTQSLKDIEIICINDGSTDSSPDIIREYMARDARVKMIDKANSGYGDSMNRGLEMACGEYVGILESDDFMFEDSLQKLVAKADAEHADVVKGDFYLYWSTPSKRRELFGIIDEYMTGAAYRPVDRPGIFYRKPSIWSAIYRREFLNDNQIRFLPTPGASYQDAGFNFKVWACAERAAFITDPILCYRQDNEKSSVNSPNKVFCVCDEYAEMQRFLDQRPELKARLQGILMRMKVDTYRWNDERLVDGLREQFWEKASPELKADWDAGRFDLSLFDPRGETDLRLMVRSPRAYIDSRFDFKKPGKLNTFKHYFKIGGLPLVWRVLAYQRTYGDNPHPDDIPAAQQERVTIATPKISVVVPIYKVEECLAWCLDSLLAQDMPDWEGVLVNDGSPDGSRDIAAAYCEKDARFTLVDKENGGLSSARNAGIAASSAPIVAFLDSDDRFTPDACRAIVDVFEREDCDVLTFGANPYPLEAGYPWLNYVLSPRDASFEGYSSDLLFKEASRPFAWRTACKREFLLGNGIVFDETVKYGEDQVFDFAVYGRSRKTALISNKLYDYRVARKGSLMDTMRYDDETRLLEHVKIYSAVLADWHRDGLDDQHADDLAYFLCDLVLYDALRLLSVGCGKVFAAVAAALDGSAVDSDAALAQCAPSVAAMVRAALVGKAPAARSCKKLMFDYDVLRFGHLGACKRMAANALGKREV